MMQFGEKNNARSGNLKTDYQQRSLARSKVNRDEDKKRRNIIKAHEMPWEQSPQGLIKHMVNEEMNCREHCLDIYQQFLSPAGQSGKHRHVSEEVLYVLEGKGYDLHWDVKFDCKDEYIWDWAEEPKKFEWEAGDFVYIPPYVIHQHFNADPESPARFISVTSRIIKAMGFDWFDQLEPAPEAEAKK
ncbi:MAG: cupin [Chloroflexi bacterium]|nr:cupin [Chloroflexota bacterium]